MDPDGRATQLAAEQGGVLRTDQALSIGLTQRAITYRVATADGVASSGRSIGSWRWDRQKTDSGLQSSPFRERWSLTSRRPSFTGFHR